MSDRYVTLEDESLYSLMERVNSVTTITNSCDGTYAYRLISVLTRPACAYAVNALRPAYVAVLEDRRVGYTAVPKELK